MFVDDLQWAGPTPLGAVDLLLSEEPVDGLLLVGAYRDGDIDAAHPLAAPLARWRDQAGVRARPRSTTCRRRASSRWWRRCCARTGRPRRRWPRLIEPHTRGNPYETVELLNALRRDGVLTPASDGWQWDAAAVRAQLEPVRGGAAARRRGASRRCRRRRRSC